MGLFRRNEHYAKIDIEIDLSKKEQKPCVVSGDEETIASVIGSMVKNLIEEGFDKELLQYAIEYGFGNKEKVRKNITVKEIKVDEDKAKDLEQLLNKLMED